MADNSHKREEVIQHLQMIQAVIARMNSNSFSLKRWGLAFLLALIFLISNTEADQLIVALIGSITIMVFWYLDSFYLWQERGYVALYNKIRQQKKTDFEMRGLVGEVKFANVFFSKTICVFYLVALLFPWFSLFLLPEILDFLIFCEGIR